MIFDKNVVRIKELSKFPEKNKERIDELNKRGPEYWVRYQVDGKRINEKVPQEYQSKIGARKYEAKKIYEAHENSHLTKSTYHVKISEIVDTYISEKMHGKSSLKSAQTICNHIKSFIGEIHLDTIDKNPKILINHFKEFPEKSWSQKYKYNYFLCLRAAINYWIKFRRLRILNPCNVVQVDEGTKVLDYVPTPIDLDKILVASFEVGLPNWVRRLFIVTYETGLRINEVMKLQKSDIELNPKTGLPYIKVWVSKQKRKMQKARPISFKCAEALREQFAEMPNEMVWPYKNPPYKLIKKSGLREESGYSERWFHDFRKTAKLNFREHGGKEIAKEMLGHKTDAMDDYYTHYQRKNLEIAVKKSYKGHQKGHQK